MFCTACGQRVVPGSTFCQSCGAVLDGGTSHPPSVQLSRKSAHPQKSRIFWLTMGGLVLAAIAGMVARSPSNDSTPVAPQQTASPATAPAKDSGQVASKQVPDQPIDPKARKAAERQMRETYATETQKELWRQGMEMTLQARGTTLYVRYVLAGDAFKFQFQEQFVQQNAETLKALGFTRVELTNDDTVWSWNLRNN